MHAPTIRKWSLAVTAFLLGILIVSGSKPSWSEEKSAQDKGKESPSAQELVITDKGKTSAVIVVAEKAGANELSSAEDLAKYIAMMSGATPAIADTPETITAALQGKAPALLIGQEALKAEPSLVGQLKKAVTVKGLLRSDAIVLQRKGNRVYLAGSNDLSHYYAVVELLRRWGCRWYLPAKFGECIPRKPRLTIGDLDYTYAPPFEIRSYWIS